MKNFLKRNKLILILAVIVIVIIIAKTFFKTTEKTTSSSELTITPPPIIVPTIIPQTNWQKIIPGKTSKNDLEQILGKPLKTKNEDNITYSFYQSNSKNWPAEITISKLNNTITFVKDYLPKTKYTEFLQKFGNPELKNLYGLHSQNGFLTFVWPQNGIAVIANENLDEVIEVWYFSQTTKDEFLATWGKDLKTVPIRQF